MLLLLLACTGDADDTAPKDSATDSAVDSADTGETGDTDETGESGDTGDTSDTSDTGDTGETGETGDPGPFAADASVSVHPDVATILRVTWTELRDVDEAWLSWELDGETWTSPRRPHASGLTSEVVLGLPADTSVTLTLHAVVGDEEQALAVGEATTGPLPRNLIVPTLTLRDDTAMRPEPFLLTSVDVGSYNFFGPCYVVILDAAGRVVWYRGVSGNRLTMFPKVARSGGYLLWDATSYYAGGTPSITRATVDLATEEVTDMDAMGLAYDELDDGSFLFDETVDGYQFYLTRQHPDGTRERLWECYPWMSSYYTGYWGCAPNTVLWSPERGTVLWSMFETNTVVELDLTTGELLREFGDYPGGYTFDPPEAAFDLQHYPNWTADGTLMVSTHVHGRRAQYAREVEIDDSTETVRELWSYTSEAGYYADYAGQAQKLASGNLLWQIGTDGVITEVTRDGEVVWEVDWANHLTGNVTPIADLYDLQSGW